VCGRCVSCIVVYKRGHGSVVRGRGGVTGFGLVQIRHICTASGARISETAAPTTHTPKIINIFSSRRSYFHKFSEKMVTWNATNDRKLLLAVLKVSSHRFVSDGSNSAVPSTMNVFPPNLDQMLV
jgi:hypothetical protein